MAICETRWQFPATLAFTKVKTLHSFPELVWQCFQSILCLHPAGMECFMNQWFVKMILGRSIVKLIFLRFQETSPSGYSRKSWEIASRKRFIFVGGVPGDVCDFPHGIPTGVSSGIPWGVLMIWFSHRDSPKACPWGNFGLILAGLPRHCPSNHDGIHVVFGN